MKKFSLNYLLVSGILTAAVLLSCNVSNKEKNETPLLKAKDSIYKWMDDNKDEYPNYQPVEFGEITARYERTDRTAQLHDLIELEKANTELNQHKLDSLLSLLAKNKGLLLGYTLNHRYKTTSEMGEILEHENLFFLDSSFRVATILNPDAYDMILDEKLIFRPDSTFK
ncbi:MAG: hypothetical protein AB9846_17405 [Tenuifilaceae bacterium]